MEIGKEKQSEIENIVRKGFVAICDNLGQPIADCLADVFTEAYKMCYEDTINKACEWIKYHNENGGCLFDNWEESFRKAMEDDYEQLSL